MNISSKTKIQLLQRMKLIRTVEENISLKYKEQQMRCPTHLCSGQEAVAASVGLILNNDDFAVSTHRAHGHYLGKGGNIDKMIAEIYGKSTGCSSGKGGSMHLIDKSVGFMGSTAIVGGTIPVGVGIALSFKLKKTKQISCVFFGDGSIEEGVFYESVNFAALKKLPVLFICENNLYSVYSPLKVRQPSGRNIYEMVEAMGIESDCGNGNDAVEVYEKVSSASEKIRSGNGPFFFEFNTYRWREHCGPDFDNDIGYRTQDEYRSWKEKDPILLLEKKLLDNSVISPEEIHSMEKNLQYKVDKAFDFAVKSPFPDAKEVFTHVYCE